MSATLRGKHQCIEIIGRKRFRRKVVRQGSKERNNEQVGKHTVTSSFYAITLKRKEGKLLQLSTMEAWGMRAKHLKRRRRNCMGQANKWSTEMENVESEDS
jgi:hypothetical protein